MSFTYSETYPLAIVLFAVSIAIGGADMFKIGFKNLVRFEFRHEDTYDDCDYWSSYYWGMARRCGRCLSYSRLVKRLKRIR